MLRARDTTDAAFEQQRAAFRAMTPNERLAIGMAMSDDLRTIAEAGVRDRHPAFDDRGVADALARVLLGPELAAKVDSARHATTR